MPSFFSQLTQFTDNTLEKPFRMVEAKVEEVSVYVGKWLQFQSLWDIEAEQVYNVSPTQTSRASLFATL